jgi:hypothetical protein
MDTLSLCVVHLFVFTKMAMTTPILFSLKTDFLILHVAVPQSCAGQPRNIKIILI